MNYLLIVLSLLYTAFLAKSLLLPIFIALFLSMSVVPVMAQLQKLRIPKPVSALCTILLVLAMLAMVVMSVTDPLKEWITKFPSATEDITQHIDELSKPLNGVTTAEGSDTKLSVRLVDKATTTVMSMMASSTPALLAQILATLVLSYFFLTYGEDILSKTVTIRTSFAEKKITVDIVRSIQSDISFYLFVIVIINTLLGLTVAVSFYLLGVKDAALWGFLAMVLNFVPYLGLMIMSLILIGVGLTEYTNVLSILMPVGVYLFLNIIEANVITPTVLGKRLKLNPLIVLIWLFVWGWLWGAAGFLLGVPMLVCLKIIAQQTDLFGNWVKLLEESK